MDFDIRDKIMYYFLLYSFNMGNHNRNINQLLLRNCSIKMCHLGMMIHNLCNISTFQISILYISNCIDSILCILKGRASIDKYSSKEELLFYWRLLRMQNALTYHRNIGLRSLKRQISQHHN